MEGWAEGLDHAPGRLLAAHADTRRWFGELCADPAEAAAALASGTARSYDLEHGLELAGDAPPPLALRVANESARAVTLCWIDHGGVPRHHYRLEPRSGGRGSGVRGGGEDVFSEATHDESCQPGHCFAVFEAEDGGGGAAAAASSAPPSPPIVALYRLTRRLPSGGAHVLTLRAASVAAAGVVLAAPSAEDALLAALADLEVRRWC